MFQAAAAEDEMCFAEVPMAPAAGETAASIQYGALHVEIHAGADRETIQAIIQALKSC